MVFMSYFEQVGIYNGQAAGGRRGVRSVLRFPADADALGAGLESLGDPRKLADHLDAAGRAGLDEVRGLLGVR